MKKMILICTMILSGIIGGTGWIIARACLDSPEYFLSLTKMLAMSLDGMDLIIIVSFYFLAILGIVLGILDIYKK